MDDLRLMEMVKDAQTQFRHAARFLLVYTEKNVSFKGAVDNNCEVLADRQETFETRTVEQLLEAHVLPAQLERNFRERYLW